jgi:hypothetical protein
MTQTAEHNGHISEGIFSAKDAAEHLGIKVQSVYTARNKGRLRSIKDEKGIWFSKEELDRYRQESSFATDEPTQSETPPEPPVVPPTTETEQHHDRGILAQQRKVSSTFIEHRPGDPRHSCGGGMASCTHGVAGKTSST